MKKLIIVLLFIAVVTGYVQAQEIGVRFGDIVGNNVAIDAVFGFKGSRIHADVSFGSGVGLEALYDFVYEPIGGEAFNYYFGAGVYTWLGNPFLLGISGEIGIEYHFNKIPIAFGLDWRPSLRIIDNTDFIFKRFGFNIRWVF